MTNKPIKCASADFNPEPFYLIQSNGTEKRLVASFGNKEKIKDFLLFFINKSKNEVQIKIREFENEEDPVDYVGNPEKSKLLEIFEKYEEVIFHDGYHALMIRLPETGEYIAFDEHGLLFIYSQNDYSGVLNELGLKYKVNEKLIYQFGHWLYSPPNGKELLKNLISELQLK